MICRPALDTFTDSPLFIQIKLFDKLRNHRLDISECFCRRFFKQQISVFVGLIYMKQLCCSWLGLIGFVLFQMVYPYDCDGQLLQVKFPDTLECNRDSVEFISTESAKTHYWHPVEPWTEDTNFLNSPVPNIQFIKMVIDNNESISVAIDSGVIYLFMPNHCYGLVCLKYSHGFQSKPVLINYGWLNNTLLGCISNIHILKEGDKWYGIAFITGTENRSRIVRLEFGNSLNNIPKGKEIMIYNGSQLASQIYMTRVNGALFGYGVDRRDNGFTQINFGNSVMNTPEFTFLKVPYRKCQFRALTMGMDASGNHWILAPTISSGNFVLVKLGKDPLNKNPEIDSIGMFGIPGGDYLGIMSYTVAGKTFVWLNNENNRQNFFYFGNGIYKPPTVVKGLGNPFNAIWDYGGMTPPFRFQDTLYAISNSDYEGLYLMKFSMNNSSYYQSLQTNFIDRNTPELHFKKNPGKSTNSEIRMRYVINEGRPDQRDTIFSVASRECPIDPNCKIWVPDAFSPNGNGLNDLFGMKSSCEIYRAEMIIYNRWGQAIHRSQGENPTWDGRFAGEDCPEGVYAYKLVYQVGEGFPEKAHSGTLFLSRKY